VIIPQIDYKALFQEKEIPRILDLVSPVGSILNKFIAANGINEKTGKFPFDFVDWKSIPVASYIRLDTAYYWDSNNTDCVKFTDSSTRYDTFIFFPKLLDYKNGKVHFATAGKWHLANSLSFYYLVPNQEIITGASELFPLQKIH